MKTHPARLVLGTVGALALVACVVFVLIDIWDGNAEGRWGATAGVAFFVGAVTAFGATYPGFDRG